MVIPSLFGGVGYYTIGSDANGVNVLRDSVHAAHDPLIVPLEEHGNPREDIDKRQELIARQVFPERDTHSDSVK